MSADSPNWIPPVVYPPVKIFDSTKTTTLIL
jgi:hypothetical protein